jgi:hypothetical protein
MYVVMNINVILILMGVRETRWRCRRFVLRSSKRLRTISISLIYLARKMLCRLWHPRKDAIRRITEEESSEVWWQRVSQR